MSILRFAVLSTLVVATPGLAWAGGADDHHAGPDSPDRASSARLIQLVRDATRPFKDDLGAATTTGGYAQFLGCVSGPEAGAMGVHFVNDAFVRDGVLDPSRPDGLIYEISKEGRARLVGVEFIVDAAAWLKANDNKPPVLDGQSFQFVDSPNRFNLDPFFELHVWAWRDNPNGASVDWNTRVSCEGQ